MEEKLTELRAWLVAECKAEQDMVAHWSSLARAALNGRHYMEATKHADDAKQSERRIDTLHEALAHLDSIAERGERDETDRDIFPV